MRGFERQPERVRRRTRAARRRSRLVRAAASGLLALVAAAGWSGRARAQTPARDTGRVAPDSVAVTPSMAAAREAAGRGFSHERHRGVACASCHLSARSHGALKVQTHQDCQACHHSSAQPVGCASCHRAGELPGPGTVSVPVRTSVAPSPMARTLPFAHEYHRDVSCGSCHGAPPAVAPVKACASCHERHHTADRDCQRCHRPQDVRSHPSATVHSGCSGAGCHGDAAVAALPWSRTVCLSCHQDRVQHAPGGDCAACHQVPALGSAREEVAP